MGLILFIYSSLQLYQDHGHEGHPEARGQVFTDEELAGQIDPVLGEDDLNKDGCIDYPEFLMAQNRAAARSS